MCTYNQVWGGVQPKNTFPTQFQAMQTQPSYALLFIQANCRDFMRLRIDFAYFLTLLFFESHGSIICTQMSYKQGGGLEYMAVYVRPASLAQALEHLGAAVGAVPLILAGGTDYYPAKVGKPLDDDLLDITAIPELRGVSEAEDHWRIGATTSWGEIAGNAELPPLFDGLRLAARDVGGTQIQNAGTIAGNLCNASPAADGVPILLAMRARVELSRMAQQGQIARRELALGDFITGNRQTRLAPGELLSAILVQKPRHAACSTFLKLGARRYLVISIAMVGVVLEEAGGVVQGASVAIGACSAVAQRLPALETELIGRRLNAGLANKAKPEHFAALTPIDDMRADAEFRREAALTLTRRALGAAAQARG